jgi:O-antigen ligase
MALLLFLPYPAFIALRGFLSSRSAIILTPLRANLGALGCFGLVVFSSILFAMHPTAFWGDDAKWIFLIAYGFLITFCASYAPLFQGFRAALPWALLVALALLLGSIYYDMMYPLTFSMEPSRPAGFPGNSNYAALMCVILCSASLDYMRKRPGWIDCVYILVTLSAIMLTMSRSGMANFGILMVLYGYHRFIRDGIKVKQIVSLFIGVGIIVGLFVVSIPVLMATTTIFQGKTRLGQMITGQRVDDGSAASRIGAVEDALRLIDESPIIGHGTGHSRTMAELPHNLYLQQWVNNGLPGLLGYLLMMAVAFWTYTKRRFYRGQAFIIVALVGGLFSHNILDQRPFLILFGVLLTLSWVEWRESQGVGIAS